MFALDINVAGFFDVPLLLWCRLVCHCSDEYKRYIYCIEGRLWQTRQHFKKQRHYFANKCLSSQGYCFSSCHVWMWDLDYRESWVPSNWIFWNVVLKKTPESPWAANRFKQSMLKEIIPGKTDVEDETSILSPPDAKSWHIWKAPDSRKDWWWEEKMVTESEMVEWHHWLSQHGYGWTPGVGDEQGALAFWGPWGYKESNMTEWLN